MKFSAVLVLAALPLLAAAAATPQRGANGQVRGGQGRGKGGNKGANAGKGGAKAGTGAKATTSVAVKATTAAAAAATAKAATGAAAANNAGQGAAVNAGGKGTATADAQSALTLDPAVLATSFSTTGQEGTPTPGQVASLTSNNNFINFCKQFPDKPITNGLQIKTGSCNPAPMGIIASTANIPSCKFVSPENLATIAANQAFDVKVKLNHLQAGNFVNAQSKYYAAPQVVNGQGDIIGHTHIVIEALTSLQQTTVNDPTKFAFFKGVDGGPQQDGLLHVNVAAGLPDGFYRMATINSAANHQPALVAVAQHGSIDDMIYFTVGKGGANAVGEDNAAQGAASALAAATAKATATGAAAATGAKATGAAAAAGAKGAAANNTGSKGAAVGTGAKGAATGNAAKGNNGKFGGFKGGKKGGKRFSRDY